MKFIETLTEYGYLRYSVKRVIVSEKADFCLVTMSGYRYLRSRVFFAFGKNKNVNM